MSSEVGTELEEILSRHQQMGHDIEGMVPFCSACRNDATGFVQWPCPTVRVATELAQAQLLAKIRIEILVGRMLGCDDMKGQDHTLSINEAHGWTQDMAELLALPSLARLIRGEGE